MRIGAREDDLRAARLAIDVLDVGDDAVARAVRLARRLLAERQDALGAAEVDDDVVALLEAADDALDELALAVLELVEDEVALFVADALDEHLLRRLRGDAAERRCAPASRLRRSPNSLSCSARLLRVVRVPEDLEAELLAELRLEALRFCASSSAISRSSSDTSSTTVMYWKRSTWPVSSLKRASSSRFGPNALCAALRIASSMVLTSDLLSIPFSLATCSRMIPRLVSVVDAAAWIAMTFGLSVSRVFAGFRSRPFGLRR